jgi:hypothetical protein
VAIGFINNRPYAFIGLERQGGVMIFDISVPTAPTFVQYINNRNFNQTSVGPDSGPEIVLFVPANSSPNGLPLLFVANEVSGTVSIYQAQLQWRSFLPIVKNE